MRSMGKKCVLIRNPKRGIMSIEEKLDTKMEEYYKRFNEHFPAEGVAGDDTIIEIIDECLEKGEPFDPDEGLLPGSFI